MKIKKVLDTVKKLSEKQIDLERNYAIGALTRKRRLELNMTQGEVAKQICSVSYLSKIESNKLVPNERSMELLMERVKISKWDVYTLENSKFIMENVADAMYKRDRKTLDEIREPLKNARENQVYDILNLCVLLLDGDYKQAEKVINANVNLSPSMDSPTLSMYMYLISKYSVLTKEYTNFEEIVKEKDKLEISDSLRKLYEELSFRYYCETRKPILAKDSYDRLIKTYVFDSAIIAMNEAKVMMASLYMKEGEYEMAIKELSGMNNERGTAQYSEINYILAKSYYCISKDIKSKDYLDEIDETDPYYGKVVFLKYHVSQDRGRFIDEVGKRNQEKPNFYLTYFLKYCAGTLDKKDFLTKEFYTLFNNSDYYDKVELLRLEADALGNTSKYKDAYIVLSQITKYIRCDKEIKRDNV